MELKDALKVLGLDINAEFEEIRESYYKRLRELLTPNGEHWFNFKEEGDRVTDAYFVILCSEKYNKEAALVNFRKVIKSIKTEG